MAIQMCGKGYMGVHTSVDTMGTYARDLVMALMCGAPQNTHILTAQTPLIDNYATFAFLHQSFTEQPELIISN